MTCPHKTKNKRKTFLLSRFIYSVKVREQSITRTHKQIRKTSLTKNKQNEAHVQKLIILKIESEREKKNVKEIFRLLRSTGMNTRMSCAFIVGIATFVRFSTLLTTIIMSGFGRMKINQMNIFNMFTFWNVDMRTGG